MALISLEEAADRLAVTPDTIRDWSQRGLLPIHQKPVSNAVPTGSLGLIRIESCVEEEDLIQVAETLGWLKLSSDQWDDDERKP